MLTDRQVNVNIISGIITNNYPFLLCQTLLYKVDNLKVRLIIMTTVTQVDHVMHDRKVERQTINLAPTAAAT